MKSFCLVLAFVIFSLCISTGGVSMAETIKNTQNKNLNFATFAGGCFWCMEPQFATLEGVRKVTSGYTGGITPNPTYEQVSSGGTGHLEAIQIEYDAAKISYKKLLDIFWANIDPLDDKGQFCDKGSQYRAGIFVHDDEQKKLAEASKEDVKKMFDGKEIPTIIKSASTFYPAEDYHQEFYIKNPSHYKRYSKGCGREERLEKLWADKLKLKN
jgi:peptide-methionine (S)-S-oxide reductase